MVQEAILLMLQCLLSAHHLYKLAGGTNDFLKFLHDVVMQLLTFSRGQNPTAMTVDSITHLIGRNHFSSKRPYEGQGRQRATKKKFVAYATRVACALKRGDPLRRPGFVRRARHCPVCALRRAASKTITQSTTTLCSSGVMLFVYTSVVTLAPQNQVYV